MILKVNTRNRNAGYKVEVRGGLLKNAGRTVKSLRPDANVIILTNETLHSLWYRPLDESLKKAGLKGKAIVIPDGERYKSFRTYNQVISRMIECRADRSSVLVAFGGGVIGDLGGYVASTYMRGIDFVIIPTTLVAQIDSSIGGKVAIDHQKAKNLIGSFYNPHLVLTDPDLLNSLDTREFLNGIFEAIKISLVSNRRLFSFIAANLSGILNRRKALLRELVVRCVREKVKVVQKDPFDHNLRMILNFGHTFGHALETARGYKRISHGEAVGWGMLLALRLSEMPGHFNLVRDKNIYTMIKDLLKKKKLSGIDPHQIWKTIALDKKVQGGQVRFVLLEDIACPVVTDVDKKTFLKAFREI